ncbi:MAG: hypothetical protein PXY39_15110 [archaeon]|nr:hypothetical protein [archaeon]
MIALEGRRGIFNYLGLLIGIGIGPLIAGSIGLLTPIVINCPAYGCPPLPSAQIFHFYELSYIEFFSGLSLIIAGIICLDVSQTVLRSKKQQQQIRMGHRRKDGSERPK